MPKRYTLTLDLTEAETEALWRGLELARHLSLANLRGFTRSFVRRYSRSFPGLTRKLQAALGAAGHPTFAPADIRCRRCGHEMSRLLLAASSSMDWCPGCGQEDWADITPDDKAA